MRHIQPTGSRRECGGLPIFSAGRRRTDVLHGFQSRGFGGIYFDAAGLQVNAFARVLISVRFGGNHLSRCPIDDIHPRIAVGMNQDFAQLSIDGQIEQNVFVHAIVVVIVVRIDLIGPNGFAGFRTPRKYSASPLVVSGTLVGIPGTGIGCSVVDQDQAPDRMRSNSSLNRRLSSMRRPAKS